MRCLSTVHTLDENILQTHGFSSATLITEEFIEKNTIGEQRSKKVSNYCMHLKQKNFLISILAFILGDYFLTNVLVKIYLSIYLLFYRSRRMRDA